MALAGLDASERRALRIRDRAMNSELDELRVASDGVERRPELVAHHGERRPSNTRQEAA